MNQISIWKDKILLFWDGVLPPNVPSGAYHEPKDVIFFWPLISKHTTYSKKMACFLLSFSKQNIMRLHAQFGQIPIKSGKYRTDELKQINDNYHTIVQKAKAIKDLPIEKLPKYTYKMPPLAEYQHRAVVYLVNVPMAPLFADCGMGKTYCTLVSTEIQMEKGILTRGKTLIVGKLSTMETGWQEDAAKFTNLKVQVLWTKSQYKRKEKLLAMLNTPADIYLINHDGVKVMEEALIAANFEKIVIDESTILKGFRGDSEKLKGGMFGKAILRVAHSARWRAILTGTPAPNGPKDLWGQMYFLDQHGIFLEKTYNDFMGAYYDMVDMRTKGNRNTPISPRDPHKFVPKPDAIDRVSVLIEPLSFRVRMRDHLKDMPELTIMRRSLIMGPEQQGHYDDMVERLRVEINDERITVSIALTQLMKLRQITGGFIIDETEKAHEIKGNPKMDELHTLVTEEIGQDSKIIIYAQYQWEIKEIESRYKDQGLVTVYGGNNSATNLENIKKFREDPAIRFAVLHPKSGAHGITFTMAHYMIFYSVSYSAEDNYQCVKRIERAGQKHPMFVYYLLCADSIDETMFEVLELKEMNQRELIDKDEKLLKVWRDNDIKRKS